jgi:PAS domain S-box-containing protein
MTAMLDDTAADLRQIIADLQHKLDERTAELHENQERYALVSQAVAEGIYDWDIDNNALWVSPRLIEIFGLQGLSLSAADWNARVHPDDFEEYRAAQRDCFKGTTARLACEYRIRLTNGEYRWVEDHGLPIRRAAERVVRLVGAVNDITERKEAEQALRESLDQQTATAEVLGVINASPGDLAPVFDAMLEKAMRLCQATGGALRSYDGDAFHAVAMRGMSREFLEATRKVRAAPDSGLGRVERGAQVVQISDFTDTSHPRAGTESWRWMTELGGICTSLWVALRKEATLLGTFVLYRKEVRPFSDKEISLVQSFAAQAVIAMENARPLTETREALEQQTATAELLQVINSSPGDLKPVFEAMLEKATSLCGAAFGVLWIVDADQIRAAASHQVPVAYRDFLTNESSSPGPRSGVAQTIREKSVLHLVDAASGEAYRSGDPFAVAAVELGGVRTLLNAPLIKDGNVLGILAIYRKEVRPFSDKEIALVESFAAQAVIAMENARLLTETREALDQQTATAEVLQVINSSPGDLTPVFGQCSTGQCGCATRLTVTFIRMTGTGYTRSPCGARRSSSIGLGD